MAAESHSNPARGSKANPRWKKILLSVKIIVTVSLVCVLVFRVDWQELWAAARKVQGGWLALSTLLMLANEFFTVLRLKALLRPTRLRLSTWRLMRIGYISTFYAFFLPAGVGYAIARWYKVTQNQGGQIQFIVVSAVEKSLFFFITMLCVGIPLAFSGDPKIGSLRVAVLPAASAIFAALALFYACLLSPPLYRFARASAEALGRVIGQRLSKTLVWVVDLNFYQGQYKSLALAALASSVVQAMIILRLALLYRSVGVQLPWPTIFWISSLVFMVQALPISFWGIGVREFAFAEAFRLFSVQGDPNTLGALVGLLFLGQMVVTACVGGALEITDRGNQPHASSP